MCSLYHLHKTSCIGFSWQDFVDYNCELLESKQNDSLYVAHKSPLHRIEKKNTNKNTTLLTFLFVWYESTISFLCPRTSWMSSIRSNPSKSNSSVCKSSEDRELTNRSAIVTANSEPDRPVSDWPKFFSNHANEYLDVFSLLKINAKYSLINTILQIIFSPSPETKYYIVLVLIIIR